MQLVIDIPNRYYEMVKDFDTVNIGRCQYKGVQYQVINAIKNGKPLPVGHGRLIDADELKKHKYHDSDRFENAVSITHIDWAETIIEADKKNMLDA